MQSRKVPLVLAVLDHSAHPEKLRKLFAQRDYETAIVPDFSGALKLVSDRPVDLIVSDLNFLAPEKNELFRELRKNQNAAETPVLILGPGNGGEGIVEALEAGADDFIENPADGLAILARAAKLIERKQAGDLLRENEAYFRSLIDNVSDIISILSYDGTILYESASVEPILGHRQSDLIGKNAFDFIHPDDRERIVKYFYDCASRAAQPVAPAEYRYRDGAGNWRLLESIGKVMNHPTKGFIAVVNSRDVTERRKSENALRDSEEKFRVVLDNSLDIIYQINLKTRSFDYVSSAAKGVTGYDQEDFVNGGYEFTHSLVHPDDLDVVKGSLNLARANLAKGNREHSIEYRLNTKHRGQRWIRENRALLTDEDNQPVAIISTARDITDQKKFAESLHLQKTLLESQTEASIDGILAVNDRGEILSYNQRFIKMWEISDEVIGTNSDRAVIYSILDKLVNPQEFLDTIEYLYENSRETNYNEIRLKDGRTFEKYSAPIEDGEHRYFGRVWFFRDITKRRKMEDALRESEDNYRDIVENSQELICTHDLKGNILSVNKKVEEVLGVDRRRITNLNLFDILIPEVRDRLGDYLEEISAKGESRGLMHVRNQKGEVRIWEYNNTLRTEDVTEPIVRGMATDITERKRFEENLLESEARFRDLAESAPVWIWIAGTDNRMTYANKTFLDFTGHTLEQEIRSGWKSIHPEDLEHCREIYYEAFNNREEYNLEYRHLRADGEYRWVLLIGVPRWTSGGNFLGFIGSGLDIHERKQAEEVLRKTEEKLRQAQKLESVGRLAGGIAHDFNNMLTAIIGYSDITLIKLATDDPLRRNIEEIRKAAERSASLTTQLLAFSRQQVLQPKIVAFNELIAETVKMLQRLIGENISLNVELDPQAGVIKADPGQLTQVIVNLAVNARDAMPHGGVLTIKTEALNHDEKLPLSGDSERSGKYVLLTVEDNGAGINYEDLSHVFEPFFTTKEVGKGTGLGLATVYGIVKQSSGEIVVESEIDVGTTFKVYFPCVEKSIPAETAASLKKGLTRGTETLLIVEDEPMVRELTKEILEAEGYKILAAENGLEALEICRTTTERIDLVITDVVMPQMGGLEFSQKVRKIFPDLPVLFTSGYTEDKAFLSNLKSSNIDFLSKPFVPETLVRRVREFLDASQK